MSKKLIIGICIVIPVLIVILISVCIVKQRTEINENATGDQDFPVYYVDFRGNFSVSEPFKVGKRTEIKFSIYPTVDLYNTKIRFELPPGVELSEGKLEWNLGDVKEGEKKEVTISVRPLEDILHRNIHAFVRASTSPNLSEEVERSYACLVSTT